MHRRQERAFTAFVDELLRIGVLLTSDVGLAEDAYQETLQRLAAHWSRIDNPRAYSRRILNNVVIDRRRARARRATHRRQRARMVAVAGASAITTAAAALAVGAVVTSGPGGSTGSTGSPGPGAAGSTVAGPSGAAGAAGAAGSPGQKALYQLASVSLAAPAAQGRYAVLTERQDSADRTSVLDSLTGDVWTYQKGPGLPSELPEAVHDSPTAAEFAALSTDPAVLRSHLLDQARSDAAGIRGEVQRQIAGLEQAGQITPAQAAGKIASAGTLVGTDDDIVFDQTTDVLWNPLGGSGLRSALYKVLAQTPGVVVTTTARDSLGRAAVEISRPSRTVGETTATFESPTTGAVLESSFTGRGFDGRDIYLSTQRTDTRPANPYAGRAGRQLAGAHPAPTPAPTPGPTALTRWDPARPAHDAAAPAGR